MTESTVVFLAKRVFQLEAENSLLRAKLADFQLSVADDVNSNRMKMTFKYREAALAREKIRFEKEKDIVKSLNQSDIVTCDCACCDENDDGFDEIDN